MFIRHQSNKHAVKSRVKKEAVPQEQPLNVADIALQKVEEVLAMTPEVIEEPVMTEEKIVEDATILNEAIDFIDAEEPAEPIGEDEPAEESDPDPSGEDEGD